jgi:hypothetical protein
MLDATVVDMSQVTGQREIVKGSLAELLHGVTDATLRIELSQLYFQDQRERGLLPTRK